VVSTAASFSDACRYFAFTALKVNFPDWTLCCQCLLSVRQTTVKKSGCLPPMAQKPPDEDGLPWGLLPSGGPNSPLRERERERERDLAIEAGHSSAETKRRKRQDQLRPLTACQTHMHAQTHTYTHIQNTVLYKHFKTVTRKKKKNHSHQSFNAVINKKSKVERVNLLALWHKKFWNAKLSLQASQFGENEKEKILYIEW